MYGFKQSFVLRGLSEECKRATLKTLSTGRCVVVSRYEDDRDSAVICGELLLLFQGAHPGKNADRESNNPACARDKTQGTPLQKRKSPTQSQQILIGA